MQEKVYQTHSEYRRVETDELKPLVQKRAELERGNTDTIAAAIADAVSKHSFA